MMPIEAAQALVLQVLRARFAGAAPVLQSLNAGRSGHPAFVFRANLGDGMSVVAKQSDPALLAPYANRLIAVHPTMAEGRHRVPEPLFYDAERGVLLMEDTWGHRADVLLVQDAAAADRVLQSAGGWIGRYHATTQAKAAFNPDPHLNWLRKALTAHKSGARVIPDCDGLRAHLPGLEALAEAARGAMGRRAITHRDFHLRNLLIRKLGRVYGIDFENAERDDCIRDLLFFLTDCAKTQIIPPSLDSLRAQATTLRAAYGRAPADPAVRRFFQCSFALSAWAALDQTTAPAGPKRRRTLEVLRLLATAPDLFDDP